MDGMWNKEEEQAWLAAAKANPSLEPDAYHSESLEMFYGRIAPGAIVNFSVQEEAEKVADYLIRVHNYRVKGGNLSSEEQNRSLVFTDGPLGSFGNSYGVRDATYDMTASSNIHYIANINASTPSRYAAEL